MTAAPALAPDLCTHGLPAFRFTVQSDTSVDVAVPLLRPGARTLDRLTTTFTQHSERPTP